MREHQPATTGIEIRDIKYDYKRGRRMQGTTAASKVEYDKIAPVELNYDGGCEDQWRSSNEGTTNQPT